MDLIQSIKEQCQKTEQIISERSAGDWKIDEIVLTGQCRMVNNQGESASINMEIGLLTGVNTDEPSLLKRLDANEMNKRFQKPSVPPKTP